MTPPRLERYGDEWDVSKSRGECWASPGTKIGKDNAVSRHFEVFVLSFESRNAARIAWGWTVTARLTVRGATAMRLCFHTLCHL